MKKMYIKTIGYSLLLLSMTVVWSASTSDKSFFASAFEKVESYLKNNIESYNNNSFAISAMAPNAGLPLEKGFAVVTCFSGIGQVGGSNAIEQDPDGFVLAVMDIQDPAGEGAPVGPANWSAAGGMNGYHGPTDNYTAEQMGELFGVALDADPNPNFYVTASGLTKYNNQFGNLTPGNLNGVLGTGGEVYKINGITGAVSILATLPTVSYEITSGVAAERYVGLGQIDYNFRADVLYVSNLNDGLIYILDSDTGATIGTFDHGLLGRPFDGAVPSVDNPADPFTAIDRMVFGLGYSRVDNRLYYGVPKDANITTNQVWSISVNENGTLDGTSLEKELELVPAYNIETTDPTMGAQPTPSLISDISFGSDPNKFLLAEMSVYFFNLNSRIVGELTSAFHLYPGREAHTSRVFAYEGVNGANWTQNITFLLGEQNGPSSGVSFYQSINGKNAAGGVDWGFNNYGVNSNATNVDDAIVATGDALNFFGTPPGEFNIPYIYGIQISDVNGNSTGFPENSYMIDLDGMVQSGEGADKFGIGDVEVFGFVPCNVQLTGTPSGCNGTTYDISGTLTLQEAPATGTLTVSADGQSQVFNAPFTSPQSYNLTGLTGDNADEVITVVFSDETTCANTSTVTAPDCSTSTCEITSAVSACTGGNGTGTINLTHSGTAPFSYAWTGPTAISNTTKDPTGLDSGTYSVVITDGAGCMVTENNIVVLCTTPDTDANCNCTEYFYLNELKQGGIEEGRVHKFAINADGSVTEVAGDNGIPWYNSVNEAPADQMTSPHGLGIDVNGNLYIGATFSGPVRKLDHQGNIEPTTSFEATVGGYNIGTIDNTIYVNDSGTNDNVFIKAFDVCSGTPQGQVELVNTDGTPNTVIDWGFYLSENGTFYSLSGRGSTANTASLYVYNPTDADFTANTQYTPVITSTAAGTNPSPGDSFLPVGRIQGITADNDGNIYMVMTSNSSNCAEIYKYNSSFQFVSKSAPDCNGSDGSGFKEAIGIAYSDACNCLFVSSQSSTEDCVSTFNANTLALMTPAVGPVPGGVGNGKGIAIAKECCLTIPSLTVDQSYCYNGTDVFVSLQETLECEGIVVGGSWAETTSSANISFEVCSNSVSITGSGGCSEFTFSANNSTGGSCAASSVVTVNICSEAMTASAVAACAGGAGTGSIALTHDGTAPFTYNWTGTTPIANTVKDPSNLADGTYNVTVTDNGGCTATAQAVVSCAAPVCTINAPTVATMCMDNSTGTPADDIFTFTLNTTGTGVGGTYAVTGIVTGYV